MIIEKTEGATELMIAQINEAIRAATANDTIPMWKSVAPMTVNAIRKDGKWYMQTLDGTEEFILKSVRAGKRSELLLTFNTFDTRAYENIELMDKDLTDDTLIKFLCASVGFPRSDNWATVKRRFKLNLKTEVEDAKLKAELAEVETERQAYANIDDWGAF